jgi:hypothetical protein
MSISEKLTTVAENMPKVFEAGQKSEYDSFWDAFQAKGTLTYYTHAFAGAGWRDGTFKPKYDIKPKGSARGMFRQTRITNLKGCLESAGVAFDLSGSTNVIELYGYCDFLTTVPKTDISSAGSNTTYLFQSDSKLQTIEELKISETVTFVSSSFNGCTSLTRLIMTGTLATNGLDLHWSTKLDHESLLSIINALQNKTSGTWTVTLGSENLAKLTDAEKATATQKGWTLV